jgi:transposase
MQTSTELFLNWVQHRLVPTLKPKGLRLGALTKSQAFAQRLRPKGARLIDLPSYSPDPGPIELVFSKFK